MTSQRVLVDGNWQDSTATKHFRAVDPATGQELPHSYPISPWDEVDRAVAAAATLAADRSTSPSEKIADFLDRYATQIESRADELVAAAHSETALAVSPRLKDGELPRTAGQLRQASAAAADGSWVQAIIDTTNNIRGQFEPIGPVVVMGPNNFPFAFNSIAGGDFAAAVAAGNPVIAKAHPNHPRTTTLFAQAACEALQEAGLPPAFVQLLYGIERADGLKLVADPRIGATAFTGSRPGGMALKEAADWAGKPIYLEMSSVNPVIILPGALVERAADIAGELAASCLMGAGQFCTNPGLVLLRASPETEAFIADVTERFAAAPSGTLLSHGVQAGLLNGIRILEDAGAQLVRGGEIEDGPPIRVSNTILRTSARRFAADPATFQTECFGNSILFVVANDVIEIAEVLGHLEGNLTGCIYSDTAGSDDSLYDALEPSLATKIGRLLNDKMPTGVAVSPAMHHGGPYPSTGHPGFTSVGIPTAIPRFARRLCYDNIRPDRLPPALKNKNPHGRWRSIDGKWSRADIPD